MRAVDLFLFEDLETAVPWVRFDGLNQRVNDVIGPFKNLAEVAAVVSQRTGHPQPLVLFRRMSDDSVHFATPDVGPRRAEVYKSDHAFESPVFGPAQPFDRIRT